jgi:hypothetical protein
LRGKLDRVSRRFTSAEHRSLCSPSAASVALASDPAPDDVLPAPPEALEAGEGTEAFAWAVHAVNFQNLSRLVPDNDVKAIDDPDDPMLPSPNRGCMNWTSLGSNGDRATPEVVDLTSQPRAQMDDGAQVTCTNDRTLLHGYKEYGSDFPCPIRLHPAAKGPGILPLGEVYLRVPAPAPIGHLDFLAYYSPGRTATLLSECDLRKGLGFPKDQYSGVSHQLYYGNATWTATAHHKVTRAKDVVLH